MLHNSHFKEGTCQKEITLKLCGNYVVSGLEMEYEIVCVFLCVPAPIVQIVMKVPNMFMCLVLSSQSELFLNCFQIKKRKLLLLSLSA